MKPCSSPDCNRPHYARGFCRACHARWLRLGKPDVLPPVHRAEIVPCHLCGKPSVNKKERLCDMHNRRRIRRGSPNLIMTPHRELRVVP